jgi:hypothetical protein
MEGWDRRPRRLRSVESAVSRRDLSCDEPRGLRRSLDCPSGASQTSNGEVGASLTPKRRGRMLLLALWEITSNSS